MCPFSSAPMCHYLAWLTRPMIVGVYNPSADCGPKRAIATRGDDTTRCGLASPQQKHEPLSDALPFMTNAPPARAKASLPCPKRTALGHDRKHHRSLRKQGTSAAVGQFPGSVNQKTTENIRVIDNLGQAVSPGAITCALAPIARTPSASIWAAAAVSSASIPLTTTAVPN